MSEFEQARLEAEALAAVPGVVAVGEGADAAGNRVIVVVADPGVDGVREAVPDRILGVEVRLEFSDPIRAESTAARLVTTTGERRLRRRGRGWCAPPTAR